MGGGPQRGNRSFVSQQQYQGNQGVNPWQGGVAPSNSGNSGLLSQFSTPQQLALALTSLLQPQQQQQNNPPSLLSLNTSPFSGQDQYDSQNRFGNRGRSDFRRIDSYKVCILRQNQFLLCWGAFRNSDYSYSIYTILSFIR